MLDDLLITQALLAGLRVLSNLALASGALLLAGALAFVASRRMDRGRLATALRLLGVAALAAGSAGALVLAGLLLRALVPSPPEPRSWDLSFTAEPPPLAPFDRGSCSTWVIGPRAHRDCIHQGALLLAARFPGGRAFEGRGHTLWAAGIGDRLTSLHLFVGALGAAEALARVEALAGPWKLRADWIGAWKEELAGGPAGRAHYFTPAEADRSPPWLEVAARPLEPAAGDGDWSLSLKWHWNEDDVALPPGAR